MLVRHRMISGWTTTEVRFHNFANLSTTTDENVKSPKFSSFGHEWRLKIYPGGREDSDEGMVAVYLGNRSNESIKVEWGVRVRDATGNEVHHAKLFTNDFDSFNLYDGCYFSFDIF